ncbi:Zn(2+)-responsive transcriptional regulator [Parashewanella curva]|uniref:Zn(2+)-responsive transcriptional regulator n=1 Tax=Parashewanella curva TaxID=2338552 RepID=A0A3L8PTL7_9GAMM|nr:Zn(2+)-responsive transcriptional regulator [Parashewanella curva]RLV58755.1 Zn(2+)-responsive transcriptional regulator [Parashewanella curva]
MYRIGELAGAYDINTDTLRYYEKHGLLSPSERTESGYRIYSEQDAQLLKFILRAKNVGFTLNEIQELVSIELNKSQWACADVKGRVDKKLDNITAKILELQKFQKGLQELSDSCCGGDESAEYCSILEALDDIHHDDSIPRFDKPISAKGDKSC